jgi:probable HAF family extracellular repeat protein
MVNERLRQIRSIVLTLTLILTLTLAGGAQTFTKFTVGPYSTYPTGLNDAGEVVGIFTDTSEGGYPAGFWRTPGGKIHQLTDQTTYPWVEPQAVNDGGEFVGGVEFPSVAAAFTEVGTKKMKLFFEHKHAIATAINAAGYFVANVGSGSCSLVSPQGTVVVALPQEGEAYTAGCTRLNNLNQIVGTATQTSGGAIQGFFYDANSQQWTNLSVPGAVNTAAAAINDSGEVVGQWEDTNGIYHGFTWTSARGYVSFDVPRAVNTWANGINASGAVAGGFNESSAGCFPPRETQGCPQGFLLVNGTFTTVNVPKAILTDVVAINSSNLVVGYSVTEPSAGVYFSRVFLYTPAK